VINQGDIFWIDMEEPEGSGPGERHPHIVIQNNLFNHSKISTTIVCPLTTNLDRAKSPGNVLIDRKESSLPKQSVANVTQIFVIDKSFLDDYAGSISTRSIAKILNGVNLLLEPREPE
jgi:mRNA interferase MazF